MKLSELIKTHFKSVKDFTTKTGWTNNATRTLMSRNAEVMQLSDGNYILLNKHNKVIKVKE
jgi:hypothetical protein